MSTCGNCGADLAAGAAFCGACGTAADGSNNWVVLNRVLDPSGVPSQILGQIKAEGSVYLINRNGIIFGGASQVNVGSLIATSLNLFSNTFGDANTPGTTVYRFLNGGIGDLNAYFRNARSAARRDGAAAGELLFNLLDEFVVRNTRPYIPALGCTESERGNSALNLKVRDAGSTRPTTALTLAAKGSDISEGTDPTTCCPVLSPGSRLSSTWATRSKPLAASSSWAKGWPAFTKAPRST